MRRAKFLRTMLRRPLLQNFRLALHAELQSTRDLLNFDVTNPLSQMYRDERRASLIQAGVGLATAAASFFYPPLALSTPATLYGSYKAAQLFRPAAFALGVVAGAAGALGYETRFGTPHHPDYMPPMELPSAPAKPERPTGTTLALTRLTANALLTRTPS